MKNINPSWTKWLVGILIFIFGFGIRVYQINNPPLDFHMIRQLRGSIIARGYYYQLQPTADQQKQSLAIQLSSQAQRDVYEPSVLESIVAISYVALGSEQPGVVRFWNALFWVIGGVALWLVLRRHVSFPAIVTSLAVYLFLPLGIQVSRSFQPETLMVMCILLTIWLLARWMDQPTWKRALAAGLMGGVAILIKITAALFLFGSFIAAVLFMFGIRKLWKNPQVYGMAILCLAPMLIFYVLLHGSGAGQYFQFWTLDMAGMIISGKFYNQWLGMIESISGLTLFGIGLLGFIISPTKLKISLSGLWIGYLVYGLTWPFQYTTHNYYHTMLIPILAISIAPVTHQVVAKIKELSAFWRVAAAGLLVFSCAYVIYAMRSQLLLGANTNEPESWQRVGDAIPAEKHFAALVSDYGVRLNYYGWRSADIYWPNSSDRAVQELRGVSIQDYHAFFENNIRGVDLFLVAAYDELEKQPELKQILSGYQIFYEGNGFTLYDLTKPVQ